MTSEISIANLKKLGLKEYESRAYTGLLEIGQASAEQISEAHSIPLPRVYDTMNSLARRGLLYVSNTRPKIYRAVSPKTAVHCLLKNSKTKFEKKLIEMQSASSILLKESTKTEWMPYPPSGENSIWSLTTNGTFIGGFIDKAKEECLIFGIAGLSSNVDKILNLLKKRIKVKIITDVENEVTKLLSRHGAKVKVCKFPTNCIIVDGKIASILQRPSATSFYEAFIIEHSSIAQCMREYFLSLWNR